MAKKYLVTLTDEEREMLGAILDRGTCNAQKRKRAQAEVAKATTCWPIEE